MKADRRRNLQQRTEQSCHRFAEKHPSGAVIPVVDVDTFQILDVVHEHVSHGDGQALIVDQRVDLEILVEAANIHVGCADGAKRIVNHDQFRVCEAFAVEIDLDSGIEQQTDI